MGVSLSRLYSSSTAPPISSKVTGDVTITRDVIRHPSHLVFHKVRQNAQFKENAGAMQSLIEDLEGKVSVISQGGGAEARKRHTSKGKLLVRQRIDALLDTGSPFLELSQLAGYKLYREEVNAGGIVTGE